VRPSILLILGLSLSVAPPAGATTFAPAPIAPALGLDALTRSVARQQLGRDVFSNPYATVTISHVDVYDRFPYLEARRFEIVSDPAWSRLVVGEIGQDLVAYDGANTTLGALSGPHGMAVDDQDRLYVADTGNDRVVVLQVSTEFGAASLAPSTPSPVCTRRSTSRSRMAARRSCPVTTCSTSPTPAGTAWSRTRPARAAPA